MDLQELIDLESKRMAKIRSQEMMTLGQFIEELEKQNPKAEVFIEPFHLVPIFFCSYRGYYSDLCLTYMTKDEFLLAEEREGKNTVEKLLKKAKECTGKTFQGYKGGEFKMDKNTPIWISDSDWDTDMAIQDIEKCGDTLVFINCYKKD